MVSVWGGVEEGHFNQGERILGNVTALYHPSSYRFVWGWWDFFSTFYF